MRNLELGRIRRRLIDRAVQEQCRTMGRRPEPQKATRWKARVHVRGHDGIRQEIVRFGRTRHESEAALDAAVMAILHGTDGVLTRNITLVDAGEYWLLQISRPNSGLSAGRVH